MQLHVLLPALLATLAAATDPISASSPYPPSSSSSSLNNQLPQLTTTGGPTLTTGTSPPSGSGGGEQQYTTFTFTSLLSGSGIYPVPTSGPGGSFATSPASSFAPHTNGTAASSATSRGDQSQGPGGGRPSSTRAASTPTSINGAGSVVVGGGASRFGLAVVGVVVVAGLGF